MTCECTTWISPNPPCNAPETDHGRDIWEAFSADLACSFSAVMAEYNQMIQPGFGVYAHEGQAVSYCQACIVTLLTVEHEGTAFH